MSNYTKVEINIRDEDIDVYLNNITFNNILNEEQKQLCEGEIWLSEIDNAIK